MQLWSLTMGWKQDSLASLQSHANSIKNALGFLFAHLAQRASTNSLKKLSVCDSVNPIILSSHVGDALSPLLSLLMPMYENGT